MCARVQGRPSADPCTSDMCQTGLHPARHCSLPLGRQSTCDTKALTMPTGTSATMGKPIGCCMPNSMPAASAPPAAAAAAGAGAGAAPPLLGPAAADAAPVAPPVAPGMPSFREAMAALYAAASAGLNCAYAACAAAASCAWLCGGALAGMPCSTAMRPGRQEAIVTWCHIGW